MSHAKQIQAYQGERMYYVPSVGGQTNVLTQPWVQNYAVADDYALGTESSRADTAVPPFSSYSYR